MLQIKWIYKHPAAVKVMPHGLEPGGCSGDPWMPNTVTELVSSVFISARGWRLRMRRMTKDKLSTKLVNACIKKTIRTRRECKNDVPALDDEEYVPPISNELKKGGFVHKQRDFDDKCWKR